MILTRLTPFAGVAALFLIGVSVFISAPQAQASDKIKLVSIPARFRGEWNQHVQDCGTDNNDTRLQVSARSIDFYESHAQVITVTSIRGGSIMIKAAFSGEGSRWVNSISWRIDRNGDLVSGVLSRQRCPIS